MHIPDRQIGELCFHRANEEHVYVPVTRVGELDILPLFAKHHAALIRFSSIPRRIPVGTSQFMIKMESLTNLYRRVPNRNNFNLGKKNKVMLLDLYIRSFLFNRKKGKTSL